MNTREREVMDALATALREADSMLEFSTAESRSALAAYDCLTTDEHDALLAEGSASSEEAEAVGYLIRWNHPAYRDKTTVSDIPCHPDDGTSFPLGIIRCQPALV